ncbi:MAG: ABC transporter ATP-binding protein [Desulfomonilia bacterium]|jgi:ABC-type Fe3+/spermidine/putrescine transport system ATPase subunit|uniref:Fe(3+) ions import ATP-binding protein FbpC n=1 Tax=anaerobic digester metagenome TaxID=1263854 RepID=A0A485M3T0_9ZZZZ|nr:ABC transporter ATP-binding protein [Pseudomonadota bacterium]HON39627.1 ABC transporter ATP-binding protein [Deltaproteobacteria bacterium]HRS57402.1 ABC transporter ATP-binding protein [Desulfomonilia bacterium]HPD22614.1 ABC transporter ATP-binding protein [Deltaproteobacteria bacterium]HPW69397.1 ABC transporter ATP-binding protein [Deltaproteobacteria bacterium]
MAFLQIKDVFKTFGNTPVLRGVSLAMEETQILCILGPSGSGKTTLLRIIAGLEHPDQGSVLFKGRDLRNTRPHLRRFGMMFQEYALFPHLDVSGNIAFGLHMLGLPRSEIEKRTGEMLSLVGLQGLSRRSVSELSGGERQRVALARSLAPYPRLLLLDEPLGSLDRVLREKLLLDLREILRRIGMTTIVVTHDQAEAFAIADTVAVMFRGKISQMDAPESLYRHPANPEIARFLGLNNLVQGRVKNESSIATPLGLMHVPAHGHERDEEVTVLIRPDAAVILPSDEPAPPDANVIEGIAHDCLFKGRSYHVEFRTSLKQALFFDLPQNTPAPASGDRVRLLLSPDAITVLPGRIDQ